jgi:hypothetical protein
MLASAPIKRSTPPSHASAHADAQRRPSGTKVENPFRRIASPIRTPATTLPPSEPNATMADRRDAAFAANWSPSTESRDPSTVMTFGLSGVCGASVMVAATARAVASMIDAIEMRRRIDAGYHVWCLSLNCASGVKWCRFASDRNHSPPVRIRGLLVTHAESPQGSGRLRGALAFLAGAEWHLAPQRAGFFSSSASAAAIFATPAPIVSAARFSPRGVADRFGLGGNSLALRRCALLMASELLSDNGRPLFEAQKGAPARGSRDATKLWHHRTSNHSTTSTAQHQGASVAGVLAVTVEREAHAGIKLRAPAKRRSKAECGTEAHGIVPRLPRTRCSPLTRSPFR